MTNPDPKPFAGLGRASVFGVGLSIFGIIAFLVLWFALSGLDSLPRLLTSLCVPPGLIAVIVGGYRVIKGGTSPN